MTDLRIAHHLALPLVESVRNALAETAIQIEIAGSIRRRSPDVKDGEIVAIPTNATYRVIEDAVADGIWTKARYSDGKFRWGDKYRGLEISQRDPRTDQRTTLRVELFFTDRDSWGYQLALRTGPADANKRIMQYMQDTPIRCKDGAVWYADDWTATRTPDGSVEWNSDTRRRVLLPTEGAWFALWGMDYIEPHQRSPHTLYQAASFDRAAIVLAPAPFRQQSLF